MKSLLIRSLVVLAALALPASASALKAPPGHDIARIFGHTAYVDRGDRWFVRAYDLRVGGSTKLETPYDYSAWDNPTIARGDQLVGVSRDVSTSDAGKATLFLTSRRGLKELATWPYDEAPCHYSQAPLNVDAGGRVTVLELDAVVGATGKCEVNLSRTHLLRYRKDGTAEALWLPDRFARWLNLGTAAMSGDVLAISAVRSGRIALLDQRSRTFKIISAGNRFTRFNFAGPRSLLVQYERGAVTSARRYSISGAAGNWVYHGGQAFATVTACGNYAAIGSSHHLQIRDAHGRVIYRRGADGSKYRYPNVTCSGEYLDYVMLPACCDSGYSPPVKRLGDLVNLSQTHLSFIRHGLR